MLLPILSQPTQPFPWGVILAIIASVVGFALFVICLVLGLRLISRRQKKLGRVHYKIQLSNLGNTNCHYVLRALEPAGVLRFNYQMNGEDLPYSTKQVSVMPQPVQLQKPAVKGAPPKKASPMGGGIGQKSRQVGQTTGMIANIMATLGSLTGNTKLTKVGAQSRQVQTKASKVSQLDSQVGSLAKDAGKSSSQASTGVQQPESTAQSGLNTPAPVQAPQLQTVVDKDWIATPFLSPGEDLLIDLLITPHYPRRSQRYSFKVISRNIDAESPVEQVEFCNHDQRGVSGWAYFWPYLLLGAAEIALGLLVVFVLINYFWL